ncbi:uncharacterized protein LOC131090833 [Melospiza georgiana]|uniref:uncharacterized protein LOC131090833 n=1 Tax=Melospiza georgiana TaxID=44398 RepID=UPI0025AB93E7|nr:uncharacterized protein LOC131090833 [Melospiza georgiana]
MGHTQLGTAPGQALVGSVPGAMDWEGTKAALEAGVEEGSWRAAGAGEGAVGEAPAGGGWGSGFLQPLLLTGAAWPGHSPCQGSLWHQRRRLPCCPSLWMPWHCKELVLSCPQGWGVLLGCPWAAPQHSPQVLPCRLLGVSGGRGNLGRAWGRGGWGAAVRARAGPAALCRGSSASFDTWQRKEQLGMAFFCWGLSLTSHFLVGALPLVTGFPPFFLSNIIFPSSLWLCSPLPLFPFLQYQSLGLHFGATAANIPHVPCMGQGSHFQLFLAGGGTARQPLPGPGVHPGALEGHPYPCCRLCHGQCQPQGSPSTALLMCCQGWLSCPVVQMFS